MCSNYDQIPLKASTLENEMTMMAKMFLFVVGVIENKKQ